MDAFIGRPENYDERSERERRCYDLLDSLEIEYRRIDHPPAETMDVCNERAAVLGTRICKNLFLCNRQETVFYLLVMPADKQFKTSVVSSQLGVSRLHFAPEIYMRELLDTLSGSVSILGLANDSKNRVQLVMDEDTAKQELFACHPCENTSSLRFTTAELLQKVIPAMKHRPIFVSL